VTAPAGRPLVADDARLAPGDLVVLLILIAAGAGLRVAYAGQPMRPDEAAAYGDFAARSWPELLASYPRPGNHILHTALVKLSTGVFGDAPWAIRLPALLAGIAIIPLTAWAGLRLVGRAGALVGAAIVAAWGPLVLHATNARGYSLVVAASLVVLALVVSLRDRPSRWRWAAVALAVALGMWTIPIMLYPAGGVAAWYLLSTVAGDTSQPGFDMQRLTFATAGAAALTVLFYLPILLTEGARTLVANDAVRPSGWSTFTSQLGGAAAALGDLSRMGLPTALAILMAVALGFGMRAAWRVRRRQVRLSAVMVLWCAVVLLLTRRVPPTPVWLFLFPLVALWCGLGVLTMLAPMARRRGELRGAQVTALALFVVLALSLVRSRVVVVALDGGERFIGRVEMLASHEQHGRIPRLRLRVEPDVRRNPGGVEDGLVDRGEALG
jgi:uncharacterized membrane protein